MKTELPNDNGNPMESHANTPPAISEASGAIPEPPIDPGSNAGRPAIDSTPLGEQIDRISSAIAGAPEQRTPGKRGRHPNACQCPRCQQRRLSSAGNSDDSIQEVNTQTNPADNPTVSEANSVFDEETAKAIVSGTVELIEGFGQMVIGGVCDRKGKTPAFRAEAEKSAAMNAKVKGMIERGGPILIKKYEQYVKYLPEFAVGGGLLLHVGMIASQAKRIAAS